MLDHLEFILGEAIQALRRNAMMTVAAVNTAAVALFVLGGLGFTYLSLSNYLSTMPSKFGMKISIKDGATTEQIQDMANTIRQLDGVAGVASLPKEQTWRQYKSDKKFEDLLQDVKNPFPEQLEITLSELKKANAVQVEIRKLPLFDASEQPPFRDAAKERLYVSSLIDFVQWLGILLGIVTFFTAITLILNAVHLTVLARRQEISIMRLTGASHATIRWPFLLEGGIQGFLGGILAGLLLWALATYLAYRMGSWLGPFRMTGFVFPAFRIAMFLAVVGAVVGMLSAGLSVRKYLRVSN